MSIPHWRYVSYEGDGHSSYQCLNCYNYLGALDGRTWKYCPVCGCEWKGPLVCRSHETRRWMPMEVDFDGYTLQEVYNNPFQQLMRAIEERQEAKKSYWIIEEFGQVSKTWNIESVYIFALGTSQHIMEILKKKKEESTEHLREWEEDGVGKIPDWCKPSAYRVRISKENYGKYAYQLSYA